jgi:short-subunit dehydrogenase
VVSEQPVILITGASSGIGAATARLFGAKGYRVVLAARRRERLEALADEIHQLGGQALPVVADMNRLEDIQNLSMRALSVYGQVDILLNNAGFGRLDWLEKLEPEHDIAAMLRVNLLGVIQLTRAVLPAMIAQHKGHIINVSSLAGLVGTPTYSVYAASKYGVRGFTEALRREVGVYGIHVSGIYPGAAETEFADHAGIQRVTNVSTPALLRLSAEDVAQAVWRVARRPSRMTVLPGVMWLAVWLNALCPGVVDGLVERWFVQKERRG